MNASHCHSRTKLRVAVAVAVCVVGTVVLAVFQSERGVADIRLTVSETLFLAEKNPYGIDHGPPYRYYRHANMAANAQLRELFSQGKRHPHREVVPLVLGYTGTEQDAEFLIEWLQKLSNEYNQDPERFVAEDRRHLQSVYIGLGLMGRRKVRAAEQFLTNAVNGRLDVPVSFRWYNDPGDETLVHAFTGYAFLKPTDFEEQIDAAIRRAPVDKREAVRAQLRAPLHSIRHSVESLESRPITKSELERFRRNAANWSKGKSR
jgi:hypothetical protein